VTLALREIIQMATIKVMQNGPYLVQGDDVTAVDWNGATYAIPKRPFALCRCGGSTTKPFCDGTHSRSGFKAAAHQWLQEPAGDAGSRMWLLKVGERTIPRTPRPIQFGWQYEGTRRRGRIPGDWARQRAREAAAK
jgi:CDGSH-type Zn-finger protein